MINFLIALIIVACLSPTYSYNWIHDAKVIDFDIAINNILPVNYFYVQFIDVYGRNISLTEDEQSHFKFTLRSSKCRRFINDKVYTGNGLFIVRLKVFEECQNVELNLIYRNKHIQGSPFCVADIYPENCNCQREVKETMKNLKCETQNDQIDEDLSIFPAVNFTKFRGFIKEQYENSRSSSVCNYVVKSGRIFRKCYGEYVGFKMFMDRMLISLLNKVKLPDIEFLINLGDWPLVKKSSKSEEEILPMFSWCGSTDTHDIVLPTYDLSESTINMLQNSVLDILSVQKEKFHWNQKIEKAFFRGRDSRRERLELVTLAKKYPRLFNCSITNFFFYKDEMEKFGPKVPHISFFDFFEYKYQINMDGTVAAYRLPYLLAGNSVVLKQESPYYEFFYRKMVANVHYVPFSRDPNVNLVTKLKWLKTHNDEAEKIIKNAKNFVRENLAPRKVFCYFLLLFEKFRIVSEIEPQDEMEEVERKGKSIECSCTN